MFKFSAQSNVYARYNYTLNYTLKNLSRLGYDGVEVDCAHMKSTRLWELPSSQRKILRKSIEDLGIELEALSCHNHILGEGASFTSADRRAKQLNMEFNERVMDIAKEFGSKVVTTHVPSPKAKAPDLLPGMPMEWYTRDEETRAPTYIARPSYTEEDRALIVQGLGECADYAEDRGIIFAVEVYDPWDFWKDVIKDVSSSALGLNLHLAQVWAASLREDGVVTEPSLPKALKEIGSLLVHTHLMDYVAVAEIPYRPHYLLSVPGPAIVEVAPGAGQCDWMSFFKALDDIGYEGYLTVETHRTDIAPEFELACALRNLRKHLAQVE